MSKIVYRPPFTRTRDRGYVSTWTGVYNNKSIALPSGRVNFDTTINRVKTIKQEESMTDIVTPGYTQRVSTGEIISKPMNMVSSVYSCADSGLHLRALDAVHQQDYKDSRVLPFYWPTVGHIPHGVNLNNLVALVQTKCLSGIKTSTLQGIVSLAESRKTLNMVLEPLKTIIPALSYIRQLRKGNVNVAIARTQGRKLLINGRDFGTPKYWHKGPGKLIKPPKGNFVIPVGETVSASVLAYNLGVKPLMMDLEAFLKTIPKAHEEKRQTYRSTETVDQTNSAQEVLGTAYFSVSTTTKTKTVIKIRCAALVEDRFDVLSDFGMSVNDVPEAAVQLIPFSFIADYFVNISDVLGAARALRVEKILAFSTVVTIKDETTRTFSNMALKPYIPGVQEFNSIIVPLTGTESLTTIVKSRDVSIPNPTFAYNPRPFRPVVVQNLLSLFVQELSRHSGVKRTFY